MSGIGSYPEFFAGVHGHEPFPWQAEFAEKLARGELPSVIDVPTGMGKTSVVSAWLYALASQLEAGTQPRQIPLRLVFVVDRRLIVDSVSDYANGLADKLVAARSGRAKHVAALLGDGAGNALEVVTMRGGLGWDAVWLARPDQPAVVVGTVDQFGSRMLFRGYGTSEGLRPIDAALVATDAWLVVDEAHLSAALTDTARTVERYEGLGEASRDRPLRVTAMSATSGRGEDEDVFTADLDAQMESREFPHSAREAARRIEAVKHARLIELTYLDGTPKSWRSKVNGIGQDIATLAEKHHVDGGVTAVVCNTIAAARAVHQHLVRRKREAILLIGRCREFEKQRTTEEWLGRIAAGAGEDRAQDLFVVATQTIEVGADLDFDVLVTEAAPLSSLTQRFGRVNRLGERGPETSAVIYVPVAHEDAEHDLVYRGATAETWKYLGTVATPYAVSGRDELSSLEFDDPGDDPCVLDFGIRPSRARAAATPGGTEPEASFVPLAMGSHFERWAATSPAPLQDVDPAPFLRGVDRVNREVSVVWRVPPPWMPETRSDADDDTLEDLRDAWGGWLRLQPPIAAEAVSVPIGEVTRLLSGTKVTPLTDLDDLGENPPEDESVDTEVVAGVVWRGESENVSLVTGTSQLRPGNFIVLSVEVGGHDRWGWTGERGDEPVPDIAELARPGRRIRLAPEVFESLRDAGLLSEDETSALVKALAPFAPRLRGTEEAGSDEERDLSTVRDLLEVALAAWWNSKESARVQGGRGELAYIGRRGEFAEVTVLEPPRRVLSHDGNRAHDDRLAQTTDEDESTALLGGSEGNEHVGLPTVFSHGESVGASAREFAARIGLPKELVDAVGLAGEWHDLGKADPRFQAWLAGGDRLTAMSWPEPLAKSGMSPSSSASRAAASRAGKPRSFRHEAVSARLVDELIDLGRVPSGIDPALVRHLVVAHHGKARPLLPPLVDEAAPQVAIDVGGHPLKVEGAALQVDWDEPGRFASLNERYGWWGLALLETIVRLADMQASKEGR